jgi:hypothetical protein
VIDSKPFTLVPHEDKVLDFIQKNGQKRITADQAIDTILKEPQSLQMSTGKI